MLDALLAELILPNVNNLRIALINNGTVKEYSLANGIRRASSRARVQPLAPRCGLKLRSTGSWDTGGSDRDR